MKVQQSDYYQVLGVPKNASQQQVEWAFKKKRAMLDKPALNKKSTPSLTSLQEQIEQVKEAFDTLSDPKKRMTYNAWLETEQAGKEDQAVEAPLVELPKNPRKQQSKKPASVYLNFYGFMEKPFDLTPDPKYLYLSAKHKEVLAHLVFGLQENNGFLKIIGEVGTGKTTIIRSFLRELREGFNFAYVFHPCVTSLELLQSINEELGLPSDSESKRTLITHLRKFLVKERALGHRVVVIIDEAQNLDPGVLEELRLLSNLETETEKLIQIVLIGQPELEALLARTELRQLRQRITIQWELLPLNLEETRGYIQHRLNVAGGKGKIRFEKAAVDMLYRYTQGIPRMINVMADRSLLLAYTQNSKRITTKIIRSAAHDIGGLEKESHLKTAAWKVLLPGLLLAGMLYVGMDQWVDFGSPDKSGGIVDFKRLIQEDPMDLSDPGELVPAAPSQLESASSGESKPLVNSPANNKVPTESTAYKPIKRDGVLQIGETGQLVTYLSSLNLAESKAEAARWVLDGWGVLPENMRRFRAENFDSIQLDYGLSHYELNASFKKLRTFNQPVLLELTLPNAKGTKYVALLSLKNNEAVLGSADKISIPFSLVEPLWNHRAHLIWRDFEELPEMGKGFKGREAVWLQKNLRLLGFFKGREAPTYGPKTVRAVQSFQRHYGIADNGQFDTETRILLYNLLTIYETPHLEGA